MSWFKDEPKSDLELQAELKAICHKIEAQGGCSTSSDINKYEDLLIEIYKRELEPEMLLKTKREP